MRKLTEFQPPPPDDPDELLKHRFLCRGGGMLLVGSTGAGKSSFTMQCAISWALGRPAFGIEPARPLKVLIVQAENDDGDIFEELDGVRQGLELTPQEWQRAVENIRIVRELRRAGSDFCRYVLHPCFDEFRPDIAFIDPAFHFLGGETNNQGHVSEFLRTLINPLIHEFQCGVIINHHTNKPPNAKDAKGTGWTDMQKAYSASGHSEWPNWARAVLVLEEVPGILGAFNLIAAKRGARLRWRNEGEDALAFRKQIRHSRVEGQIFWSEMTEEEYDEARANRPPPAAPGRRLRQGDEELVELLDGGPLTKAQWFDFAHERLGATRPTAYRRFEQLIERGLVRLDAEERCHRVAAHREA